MIVVEKYADAFAQERQTRDPYPWLAVEVVSHKLVNFVGTPDKRGAGEARPCGGSVFHRCRNVFFNQNLPTGP